MTSVDTTSDAQAVREFWQRLELPGIFDVHAHFLPESLQRKVWAVFDSAGPKIGRPWPIRYRDSHTERVEQLRSFGVRRFSTLPYAHKPGVAEWLNDWSRDFAADIPECLSSATFYPEEGAASYVREAIEQGTEIFKIHVQVGEFHLDDPLLDDVWGVLVDAQIPTVIHAGSGPVPNRYTGPGGMEEVLERHPRLPVIVAHMGAPEYAEFLSLAERFENVHLDTTMVFTDFFGEMAADYPAGLKPRLKDLQSKVLFGSDFPTIPYPYVTGLEGLQRLGFADDWVRDVVWHNGVRLLGQPK